MIAPFNIHLPIARVGPPARRPRRARYRMRTTTSTTPLTPTPIAIIGSQFLFGELADGFNPSAAATAAPLQSLADTAGSILLLRRLLSSSAVRSCTFGGT